MSQAVKIGGSLWARFWAPSAYFDGADDKVNEGRQYPIYSTVGPNGPTKIVDRPYNSRDTDPVIYNMAICAICSTTLVDTTGHLITTEQILGCISFEWQDRNPPSLIHDDIRYPAPSIKKGIPAKPPEFPWDDAADGRRVDGS